MDIVLNASFSVTVPSTASAAEVFVRAAVRRHHLALTGEDRVVR